MSPLDRYHCDLANGIQHDLAQAMAMEQLQSIFLSLQNNAPAKRRWWSWFSSRQPQTRGLYLWGGVGRGKTYLMDTFFESLPGNNKQRVHFHRFMKDIHERLKHLPKSPNPMPIIARQIARECHVLCLDEFFVDDVADAMLLVGLLPALFKQGVVLITTSNIAPDELYKNGLQRLRFLEAIEQLKNHTQVVELNSNIDYRMQMLERSGVYHVVDSAEEGLTLLESQFNQLVPFHERLDGDVNINNRDISVRGMSSDIIWLDFYSICETPRSSSDYVEIACMYHTVLIGVVPVMDEDKDDVAKRFMHLIDALYDHRVKLVLTAEDIPEGLYSGQRIKSAFERTISRLNEMGSEEYLSSPHQP
ncbi:MAG: cell division protein ZapE [Gammaproteobacteria bacterium]|nr:cell division protein ZapE [Gammaproteobacteria bacterium]